jgi:hypothetical protein
MCMREHSFQTTEASGIGATSRFYLQADKTAFMVHRVMSQYAR